MEGGEGIRDCHAPLRGARNDNIGEGENWLSQIATAPDGASQ